MTIAYYIETPALNNTGVLQAKTLRTYEVDVIDGTNAYGYPTKNIKPTGRMFVIKDGKIIEKKTKAKLQSASIGRGINSNVATTYYSSLFTSPELALASKSLAISNQVENFSKRLARVTQRIESYEKIAQATDLFKHSNPEWFV